MPYGTIKVDTITFTSGSSDVSVAISGLVQNPTFSGDVTVTGTVSGTIVRGNTVSGATVTGTAGQFGTLTGNTAGFTTVTGTTVTGTTANFVTVSGNTLRTITGIFASGSAASPSITFSGDLDTGLFTGASNTVGIAVSGAVVLTVSGTSVGIGTTSPSRQFTVSDTNPAAAIRSTTTSGQCVLMFGDSDGDSRGVVSYENNGDKLSFWTTGAEKAAIDSSGRLLVGATIARNNFYNGTNTNHFQVEGTNFQNSGAALTCNNSGTTDTAVLSLNKSAANSIGSNTLTGNGHVLGTVTFQGNDGAEFIEAAKIDSVIDGTSGANSMPGRLVLSTNSGTANASPTERMRIDSSGRVGIGNISPYASVVIAKDSSTATVGDSDSIVLRNRNTTLSGTIAGGLFIDTFRDVRDPHYSAGIWFTRNQAAANLSSSSDIVFGAQTSWDTGLPLERARIDNSGCLLVGTNSAQGQSIFQAVGNSSAKTDPGDIRVIRGLAVSGIGSNVGAELGIIKFGALENSVCAEISAVCDDTWSSTSDTPGRLAFKTTPNSNSAPVERLRIGNNGQLFSVIPGGSTVYPGFMARAWISMNGTGTIAIKASGGITSISDVATGTYDVNFSFTMTDGNYAVVTGFQRNNVSDEFVNVGFSSNTTTFRVEFFAGGAVADTSNLQLAIFR